MMPETLSQGSDLNSKKRTTAVDNEYDYITNEDFVGKGSRSLLSVKS
jgi:hypothetical protein